MLTSHPVSDGPVLEIRNLVKTFDHGRVVAVGDVSLEVLPGEILSILGPSGCGKTTTLRIIAGLEAPDSGDVLLAGRSVIDTPTHKRNVGLVFQDLALFPHKTVAENVAFGLRIKGVPAAERKAKVDETLRLVELPPDLFADRMPSMLSGGQRQRVALARTLIVRPAVVLFDEPMSALDRRLRDRMAGELRQIQKKLGVASIYVTHDQETASMMSDKIIVMENGRVVQIGTPFEVYKAPQSRFVANFIGDMNFLEARVVDRNDAGAIVDVGGRRIETSSHAAFAGQRVTVAVRPELLRVTREETRLGLASGRVVRRHFVGGTFLYVVEISESFEIMVRTHEAGVAEGDHVWIEADPDTIILLGE